MLGLGFSRFARRYLGNSKPSCNVDPYCYEPKLRLGILVSLPPGTEMFHFPGCASQLLTLTLLPKAERFPYSDISGSKVARHLPEAYRRHAASFIALKSQGIHRMPFRPPIRKSKNRLIHYLTYYFLTCSIQLSTDLPSYETKNRLEAVVDNRQRARVTFSAS